MTSDRRHFFTVAAVAVASGALVALANWEHLSASIASLELARHREESRVLEGFRNRRIWREMICGQTYFARMEHGLPAVRAPSFVYPPSYFDAQDKLSLIEQRLVDLHFERAVYETRLLILTISMSFCVVGCVVVRVMVCCGRPTRHGRRAESLSA